MNNTSEFHYLCIILIIILIKYYHKSLIEHYTIGSAGKIQNANIDLLEQAFYKKRSPKFHQLIKNMILNKIGINTIQPKQRCILTMDELCVGDSKCIPLQKEKPVCSAGKDGINAVGMLKNTNAYGVYNNGNIHYLPRNTIDCIGHEYKCAPRYDCNPKYNVCMKKPVPFQEKKPPIKSSRLQFSPPFPINNEPKCPFNFKYDDNSIGALNCKDINSDYTCTLEPSKVFDKKPCMSVKCPKGYAHTEPGICEKEDGSMCTFQPMSGNELCGARNEFIKIENTDINDAKTTISTIHHSNESACSTACQQTEECDGFVFNSNDSCFLKHKINKSEKIVPNKNKNLFLRTPLNYSYHDNTNITKNTIQEFNNKSYTDCADECDKNLNCAAFTVGKNQNFMDCKLKSNIGSFSTTDNNFDTFKKIQRTGDLCEHIDTSELVSEIKGEVSDLENKYNADIQKLDKEYERQSKLEIQNASLNRKKIVQNKLISSKDVIIWDNINISGNIIKLQKLDLYYLSLSIIQIWGIDKNTNKLINIAQNKDIHINMSSVYEDFISKKCIDNKLNTYCSTSYNNKDNQFIEVNLNDEYDIHKIIIYNIPNTKKNNLVPLKISILDENKDEKIYAIKSSFEDNFKISDYIKTNKKHFITDKGNINKYRTLASINGTQDSFCRFTSELTSNNKEEFICSDNGNQHQHIFKKVETPYDKTYFLKRNTKTDNDDICMCTGILPNTVVKCQDTSNPDNTYNLENIINCENLTGVELKDMINKDNRNNTDNYKIDAGFYWNKVYSYYLFKNTILNNKSVVLFTVIDSDTFNIKQGYPKIVNNKTWKGLSFTTQIDSAFFYDKDIVIFTKNGYYVKYDLRLQQQLPDYPKKIINNFSNIQDIFKNKITSGINIGNNFGLLFNKTRFIEYDLHLLENKEKDSRIISKVHFDINKKYSGLNIYNWDAIVSNNINLIIFFKNNKYYIYNYIEETLITTVAMNKQWPNIWNINVNNL